VFYQRTWSRRCFGVAGFQAVDQFSAGCAPADSGHARLPGVRVTSECHSKQAWGTARGLDDPCGTRVTGRRAGDPASLNARARVFTLPSRVAQLHRVQRCAGPGPRACARRATTGQHARAPHTAEAARRMACMTCLGHGRSFQHQGLQRCGCSLPSGGRSRLAEHAVIRPLPFPSSTRRRPPTQPSAGCSLRHGTHRLW